MNTTGSKIDLDLPLGLQVFGIELDFLVLLLSSGLHKQWIAEIVVMQMKRRRIVPISIGRHRLTVRDSRVLDQHRHVRSAFSVGVTDVAFNGESVISLVRCQETGGRKKEEARNSRNGNKTPPSAGPPCLLPLHSSVPIPSIFLPDKSSKSLSERAHDRPILRPPF